MARESFTARVARTQEIIARLRKAYQEAHCELNYSDPLELLVATILSAQCTDQRVNLVTPALFKKYRTAKDYAAASQEDMETLVRTTGFYRNKAKSIRGMARMLVEKHGGKVPGKMDQL